MPHKNKFLQIIAFLGALVLSYMFYWQLTNLNRGSGGGTSPNTTNMNSFADCRAAGYPVMESFPERCLTPDGKSFVNPEQTPGQAIEVTGEIVCLPHKDTSGPITLECAIGLMDTNGVYFSLVDPDQQFIPNLVSGQQYRISGLFSLVSDSQYDIEGQINIRNIESVEN